MITLVLIDDHVMIHDAVTFQLAGLPDIALVGTGTSGEEIEPLIERYQPDVILIDLSIPPTLETNVRQAGRYPVLPAIKRLRKKYPVTKFLILSGDVTDVLLEASLDAGVVGYLLKDDGMSRCLPKALRVVVSGGLFFSPEISRRIFEIHAADPNSGQAHAILTPRQVDVLQINVRNPPRPYTEHAREMGISVSTFRNHTRNIFETLNVPNIASAIIRAFQLGILPIDLLFPVDKGLD